ncbi:LIM domain-binding protein 3-like isoform X2 [Liolophura sinensis]|uniref:LIM domain-binding protein 3-like isoform X2 n=1 Tax=Liolophura sinensis TaxID=3198878 RepID=UPI00315911AF
MASFSQYNVRLFRDSFDTPWGFRLQGGKDLGQPLTIQRVFTGSPAEGELQRGDIIVSISERQADTLTHKQAQDLIKFGGGSIFLTIKRPPPGRVNVAQPAPKPVQSAGFRPQPSKPMPQPKVGKIRNLGGHGPEFGADFSRPTPHYAPVSPSNRPQASRTMLYQVQQSLESKTGQYDPDSVITTPQYTPMRPHSQQFQSLLSEDSFQPQFSEPTPVYQSFASSVQSSYRPGPPEPEDEDYEIIPVSERKKAFMRAEPRKWAPLHIARAPKPAPKPRSPIPPSAGPEFGTDFSKPTQQWTPPSHNFRPAPVSPQPFVSQTTFMPASGEVDQPTVPAWRGSLRQTGAKQWDEEYSPADYTSPAPPPTQPKPVQSRSVSKPQQAAPVRTAQPFNPAPRTIPIVNQQGDAEGPRVVHLQYNSPMGLYSNENVQETLDGQTRNVLVQHSQSGGQNKDGPRDWSQSTLYRMIQQEEHKTGGAGTVSTKTTTVKSYQQPVHATAFSPGGDDFGASDF